ncbi:E3 ubiquitin-protein ligase RMA1H1-like isoform X1 [Rhodamnia argentea]|uniref:E3 ubiquitin-protein ligase RMA n=2 Tax=Rhodamnia argentea TaxID=178133 RepID=A0A8B8QQS8_9MYRT|nr:E3 ubiquitin-protein ligase RMA1H1-like isoform X1 [Rhodamnia argentea]
MMLWGKKGKRFLLRVGKMSIDPHTQEDAAHVSIGVNKSPSGSQKSILAGAADLEGARSSGFECNICLDSVQDPVVTLCGHLYCWPCIYKWLKVQDTSAKELEEQQQHQCPVCKAEVSYTSLIPLYGRGQTSQLSKSEDRDLGNVVPHRPLGLLGGSSMPRRISATSSPLLTQPPYGGHFPLQSQPYYSQAQLLHHPVSPMLSLSGTTTNITYPMVGIFGEMVYARLFGNSVTNLYTYPNSYSMAGNNPRTRRHVLEADKSLSRICFFLLCCILLCLLLF